MKTNMDLGRVIRIDVHAETAHDGLCGTDKVLRGLSLLQEALTAWVSRPGQPKWGRLPLKG